MRNASSMAIVLDIFDIRCFALPPHAMLPRPARQTLGLPKLPFPHMNVPFAKGTEAHAVRMYRTTGPNLRPEPPRSSSTIAMTATRAQLADVTAMRYRPLKHSDNLAKR